VHCGNLPRRLIRSTSRSHTIRSSSTPPRAYPGSRRCIGIDHSVKAMSGADSIGSELGNARGWGGLSAMSGRRPEGRCPHFREEQRERAWRT
jgi:hypothetical protein